MYDKICDDINILFNTISFLISSGKIYAEENKDHDRILCLQFVVFIRGCINKRTNTTVNFPILRRISNKRRPKTFNKNSIFDKSFLIGKPPN